MGLHGDCAPFAYFLQRITLYDTGSAGKVSLPIPVPFTILFFPEKEFKRVGYWDSFKLQSYLGTNTTPGWGSGKLILLWETSSLRDMLGEKVKGRNTVRDLDQDLEEQIEE